MTIDLALWRNIKGFMDEAEAMALYDVALTSAATGPVLEIGSYCGKSTYIIGMACQRHDSVLFAVDHHQGSEEQQPGQLYFDPDLDDGAGGINTFWTFCQTMAKANLSDTVVPVVSPSAIAGRYWQTPLAMVFIDGGHGLADVQCDYDTWAGHIMPGGFLVFHDIFMDPSKGGQAPRTVYEAACRDDRFDARPLVKTLGILERQS